MDIITNRRTVGRRASLGLGAAATIAALAQPSLAQAPSPAISEQDLAKAAKAEGSVTVYSSATENVLKRTGDAFQAKYGVRCEFLRLSSTPLMQRYATEAEAGNIAADLILNGGNALAYADECQRKGWAQSITDAKLPVVTGGTFPARFNKGLIAAVQIAPWLIVYNNGLVEPADVPKDWPDLLKPRWQGQILMVNPAQSDAYLDEWALVLDRYGQDYLTKLLALKPRIVPSGNLALQSLAADEASLVLFQIADSARIIKGAPIGLFIPSYTTGVEIQVMLTSPAKSRHPNAGRLFANYIMSPDGNGVMNSGPDGVSLYGSGSLPAEYVSPKPETLRRKTEILGALGLTA